ncbi:MAG TPA: GMC family oxidoreductase [Kofleriaceae bacterium]|nr:GMC family oxidoreductase [Kofleriaceae bacterium]
MARTVTTDVCVVGAGAAGSVLATALAGAGQRVALIEQGPRYGEDARVNLVNRRHSALFEWPDFNDDWPAEFSYAPVQSTGSAPYSALRLAGAGGTTLHWTGHTPRPIEDDLRCRTRFGVGRDFPISYGELEPWLLRAEHELGVAGDDDNPYASRRSGPFPMPAHRPTEFEQEIYLPAVDRLGWRGHSAAWAINSRPYDGRLPCQRCRYCAACPSGARYSPDRSHLLRFVALPGAELMTETKLLRLESSKDGRQIVAAHAQRRDGEQLLIRARRYVLAMGAIETPRMLLLSGERSHDRDGLGNAGGQLGAGFSDHMMNLATVMLRKSGAHTYAFPTRVSDFHRVRIDRREHGSFFINLWPGGSGDWVSPYLGKARTGDGIWLTGLRAGLIRGLLAIAWVEGDGTYRLRLDPAHPDHWSAPAPSIAADLTAREKKAMDASDRALHQLADAMGAEAIETTWAARTVIFASHAGGAAAMGTSPASGVCDRDCRVFGKTNLYLATGAVLPHQGANNPTLEIAAFALRLAAHLGARQM